MDRAIVESQAASVLPILVNSSLPFMCQALDFLSLLTSRLSLTRAMQSLQQEQALATDAQRTNLSQVSDQEGYIYYTPYCTIICTTLIPMCQYNYSAYRGLL